jgi:ketosteroid isomerase-like protein
MCNTQDGDVAMARAASAKLDLVKSICAAWARGDYSSVEWAHPEIEFVIVDGPEPGCSTGHSGLAPDLLGFQSAWDEYHSEAVEFRELDEQRVFVLTHATGRGRASGVEISQRRANLFTVRDGKVRRLVAYWNCDRALADVGLTPQANSSR